MSYDSSDRFSNWQSGGAYVAPVVEEPADKLPEFPSEERFSQNLYDYVINAADNSYETTTALRYTFTDADWDLIWSVCPCPSWLEYATDDQFDEFLLVECYNLLHDAIVNPADEVEENPFSDEWIPNPEFSAPNEEGVFDAAAEFGYWREFFGSKQSDRFGFNNCTSASEMKSLYRTLAKQYHPDRGGSIADMQELNTAYDKACALV